VDIWLTSRFWNKELLNQWLVIIDINGKRTAVVVPVYVSGSPSEKEIVRNKYLEANVSDEKIFMYQDKSYIILENQYPCQVLIDKNNDIFIKRIEIWASQKMVQDFFGLRSNGVTYACLVIHTMKLANDCQFNVIGWCIYQDELEMFVPFDGRYFGFEKFAESVDMNAIVPNSHFSVDLQEYVVYEDKKNGLYLSKVT